MLSSFRSKISAAGDRIGGTLLRATDGLIPGELRGGACEDERRGRLAIGASLVIVACGLLTSAMVIVQGPIENLPPALGVVALAALVPLLLRLTGSVRLAGHAIPIAVFAGLALAAVRGGGQLGLPFVLLPGVPILASLILSLRAGIAWAGISALGLGILALAMRAGLEPTVPVDPVLIQSSLFRGSLVMLPFTMLFVWASESARKRALANAHEAHQEAERRGNELERANRELAEFTYVAAHDLKEPLRGLHSCAGFLIEDCRDQLGSEALARAENLQRLAARMDSLIDALRRVAAIKQEDLSRQTVSLRDALEEALESISGSIAERGASIQLEGPFPALYCDRALLCTVIENLVENAMQLNPSPEVLLRIGMLLREAKEREFATPVLYLRDQGVEIPRARQKDFFRIFKRTHARAEHATESGVGMALVKKIVQVHGGEIWLDSVPGEGTTVYFSLGREAILDDDKPRALRD